MKKIVLIFSVFLMCICCTVNVFASGTFGRMVDDADILSASEKAALLATLDEISERQKCDVVIVTVPELDGETATAYADDFFDYNGYGYGADDDGILFLISTEDRKWAISTYGFGITAFTDAGQAYIMDIIKSDLSDGEYDDAFEKFAQQCDKFLIQAHEGKAYDTSNLPKKPMNVPMAIGISLGAGLIVAFIVLMIMKSSLKSVQMQGAADNYVVAGSMDVTNSHDQFLYSQVTRTERPKDNDSGSSTHTSSSGRSHGGSSGSF